MQLSDKPEAIPTSNYYFKVPNIVFKKMQYTFTNDYVMKTFFFCNSICYANNNCIIYNPNRMLCRFNDIKSV